MVICGAPDTAWHDNEVSIPCTATDAGTGLRSSGDASFTLTTNVGDNHEDANAYTGTRLVCDLADNCSQAGPIGPIKVDRWAPRITITQGQGTADVVVKDASVGTVTCTVDGQPATVTGTTSNGTYTGSIALTPGTHDIRCTAGDTAGNTPTTNTTPVTGTAPRNDGFAVHPDGENGWFVTAPARGTIHVEDASPTTVTCTVDGAAYAVSPVTDATGFTVAVETSDEGDHDVSCTATDDAAHTTTATTHLKLDTKKPSVDITTPSGGPTYTKGQSVAGHFGCTDAAGGSGVASCTGDSADGAPLDTTTAGSHTFHASVKDRAGNTASATADYNVTPVTTPPPPPPAGDTPPVPDPDDQLTFGKAETSLSLDAGQTRTESIACPSGKLTLGGSTLVAAVDQGTGALTDVQTLEAARSTDAYTFTIVNHATGRAQVKLFVACMSASSSKGGRLSLTDAAPLAGDGTVSCPAGTIAVAPTWDIAGDTGRVRTSIPSAGGGWTFAVDAPSGATVGASCLARRLSADTQLDVRRETGTASGPGTTSVTLPVGYAGVAGGFAAPGGLSVVGAEPQDRTHVFTLAGSGTADLAVLGLGLTTLRTPAAHAPSTDPVPLPPLVRPEPAATTAAASAPSTPGASGTRTDAGPRLVSTTLAATSAGVTRVGVLCAGDAACSGRVVLRAGGATVRTAAPSRVLAAVRYSAAAGRRAVVTLKLSAAARRAVRRAKGRVTITVTRAGGVAVTRAGTLKLKR